jgi:hypothetical protein
MCGQVPAKCAQQAALACAHVTLHQCGALVTGCLDERRDLVEVDVIHLLCGSHVLSP